MEAFPPLSSFFLRPHSVAAVAWPSGRRADGSALYGREGEGEPPYSFPSHSIPRIPFRPGIEWRRNRVRPFPDHNKKIHECDLDRSRLNEETSPNTFSHFLPPCRSVRASMRLFPFFRLPPFLLLLQPFSFLLLPRWSPAAAFFSPPSRILFPTATHSGRQVRLRNENERTRGEGSRGSLF